MKKQFVERVIREMIVDTRKYRYAAIPKNDRLEIVRIEKRDLDTTANWETVLTVR